MTLGKLSVVATPIGNLADLTYRAVTIMQEADYILCEDTRVSATLFKNYQIKTPAISYHQHSKLKKIEQIISLLQSGKNLALISDAGTPGLSDPGSQLLSVIRERLGQSIRVEAVPGPSALTAALSISGNGFDKFLFLGFLPHKKGRQKMIQAIVASDYSVIIYESKHRILKFLQEFIVLEAKLNANKDIIVARELTKMHEKLYFGNAVDVLASLQSKPENLKGEFVVLIKNRK